MRNAILMIFLPSLALAAGSLECNNAERLSKTSAVDLPGFQNPLTVTFWYKVAVDPGAANDLMIEIANTAITSQIGIGFRSGGNEFQAVKSGGTTLARMPKSPFNQWTFVMYRFDGSVHTLCQVQGSSAACTTGTTANDIGQFNTLFVCDDTFSAFLVGKLADLHISSAAYTDNEMQEAYSCSDFKHPKEVGYWPLWDGTSKANPASWNDLNERRNHIGRVAGTPRTDWDGPPINFCYGGAQ